MSTKLGAPEHFHVAKAFAAGELRAHADDKDVDELMAARTADARVGYSLETLDDSAGGDFFLVLVHLMRSRGSLDT